MPAAGRFVQRAGAEKRHERPLRGPRGVRRAMEITRKSFLSGAAAGLAGLTLLPAAAWAAPATETETGGGILWLRNAAGQTFTARSADGALVTLLLEKVEELKSGTDVGQYRPLFSAALPRGLLSPREAGPGDPAPVRRGSELGARTAAPSFGPLRADGRRRALRSRERPRAARRAPARGRRSPGRPGPRPSRGGARGRAGGAFRAARRPGRSG